MKKSVKRIFSVFACFAILCALAVPAFATDGDIELSTYGETALQAIKVYLNEVTSIISIENVVSVLGVVLGVAIGFIFFWWGIRKVLAITKRAFAGRNVNV
ncbi:MAG: hypothetical protein IJ262_09190 [Clostridia bacterium]|nr:hypothetical protein [Clostridia bacterium]